MAKDDMKVIMYKILRYLYECMKHDKKAELEDFAWESKLFSIPQNYWCEVIAILVKQGYIVGFRIIDYTKDAPQIQTERPFKINYEGVEFLEENSGMQKAKEFCSEKFNVILSAVIGVMIQ